MNIVQGQGYPDFCMLTKVEEDEFIKNLQLRFNQKQIYTYIGDQVVSMNPFTSVPLYGKAIMDQYRNRFLYEVQPHVYSLADDTFRQLRQQKRDQCCIITGESGAGKTEAAKIFMSYLAYVSASTGNAEPIKQKLLDSNPVLEAFGNAKTLRNDNSSRFGKYIEIQFDGAAAVQGGQMFQYLLEKSRVVGRAQGERSFHIFYDLLANIKAQAKQATALSLTANPQDYHYLRLSQCDKIDHVDDAAAFAEVEQAMSRLGFDDQSKQSTWRILSSILNLGNVEFNEGKQANTDSAVVKNGGRIKTVAGLLQVADKLLDNALVSRSLSTGADARRSHIQVWLSKAQAELARDTLSKHLYNAVFTWVVNVLNKSVAPKAKSEVVVGVLDIYGFEIFENNSFEQFCINYCNEKLQQLFIQLVLKSEQEEYIKEGIEWKEIPFFNNSPIVDLIDKNPGGIFRLLDEACLVGQSTAKTFLDKLNGACGSSKHYKSFALTQDKSIAHDAFRVVHYAGEVDYHVDQFLEKNRDTLFLDFVNLLSTSANPLVKQLFTVPKSLDKNKRPETAGSQFKLSVELLVKKLKACQPHYIRCVKSNEKKQSFGYNDERVRHQIRYLNLIETVRVRRAGFCNRQPYDRFLPRYKMISPKTWPTWKGSIKDGSKAVVEELKLGKEEYRLGNTKIFIREAPTLQKLEEARARHMPKVALVIQRVFRGFKARLFVKRMKSNLHKIRAANSIGNFYIRVIVRRWLKEVIATFRDAKNKPNFGKDLPFPRVPGKMGEKIIRGPQTFFEKLLKKWWGAMKVLSLSPEDQALMRQKVHAYTIFHGKKPWDFSRKFRADYLDSQENPRQATFVKAVQQLFQRGGDTHIWFADDVRKVNRGHKEQLRSLIVTDKHIYKYHPEKYTMRKNPTPIQCVEAIHMSPHKDTFMVLQMEPPHRDLVIDCSNHGHETYSELTTILSSLVLKISERTLPVNFATTITYNNRRDEFAKKGAPAASGGFSKAPPNTDIMLTFEQNPKPPKGGGCVIKNISKTENVVLY